MAYVTLLSDFGLQDASVAISKGILMQQIPQDSVVLDISHDISPFNAGQAAYLLSAASRNFAAGTCHVILFDLYSEKTPSLIIAEHNDQYFLSPDNGLLPIAFNTITGQYWRYFELQKPQTFTDWLRAVGRAIALLMTIKPIDLGLTLHAAKTLPQNTAVPTGNQLSCEIIHIDHFENVVINITKQQFTEMANGRQFRLQFMGVEDIDTISQNYADVREGYKLCRFNSNGHLEICVNRGRAASLFGLRLGGKYNDIKIFFE